MSNKEKFLLNRERGRKASLTREFSDEEMARDWTLSGEDILELGKYRPGYRLFLAAQLCSIRLCGRFLGRKHELSPQIINYLSGQLGLPPSLTIQIPERKATYAAQCANILNYLGFKKYDETARLKLQSFLELRANQGQLPSELFHQAEKHLLENKITLPGATVLERLVISVCSTTHAKMFEAIHKKLSPGLLRAIDRLLNVSKGEQRSLFQHLKESPPSAKISSLKDYLRRYRDLKETGIDEFDVKIVEPAFLDYLFKLAKRYSSDDIKRFHDHKRYALMICFLLESRKNLLDHLVRMHEQYVIEMCRKTKNAYEKRRRNFRKRQKRAVDVVLDTQEALLNWPDDQPRYKNQIWSKADELRFRESMDDFREFKRMEERGYGDLLLARYPSLRKYFSEFIKLPFAAARGSEPLMEAIKLVRRLDKGEIKKLPENAPTSFVPQELRRALTDKDGSLNRNAWETSLALAVKDATRSGNLYLPRSRLHVSFWNFMLDESRWKENRNASYTELRQPEPEESRNRLSAQFHEAVSQSERRFKHDDFAEIQNGKLSLKRYDKLVLPKPKVLQKTIDSALPIIRIERLLMEVDQATGFSRHFTPVQEHRSRPKNFYKTLLAALISQATNLGVVSMSASVDGVTVDMLRHVLRQYVREETLTAASAEIVNKHHLLPLSSAHGDRTLSSSDGQRFRIRADSLLGSCNPRYHGYYNKIIGIYTHISDQYAVFGTNVISCSPREALYVLDGLLANNTILKIHRHTTDTHGYTEIIFALCHLLGFYFMPRISDLKDQQLYRVDRKADYGEFAPLLNKTVGLDIIEEQWDSMIRVAASLKKRTVPAHVVVQRLTNNFPSDRLSKAFTALGRIIKTEYILRYITDLELRRSVYRQLNKGEYRHRLPRRIFFGDQGEFNTGDYEEIMNKASCLSLASNAALYWNTVKIGGIVEDFRKRGEMIDDATLSHISLLPFKHILPNGTYFVENR